MNGTSSPRAIINSYERFTNDFNRSEYTAFLGSEPVALYSFSDDDLSVRYAAIVALNLVANKSTQYTIDISQEDGGIRDSDVRDKKVLIFSNEPEKRYSEFIVKRFERIIENCILSEDEIKYVTAQPYKLWNMRELRKELNVV